MLNATNWKELKKQLRQIQGKAVFKLERVNSMNDMISYSKNYLKLLNVKGGIKIMARGRKKKVDLSYEEQLIQIEEKITKCSEEIKSLKAAKKDIEKKIKDTNAEKLIAAVEESGKSIDEVINMLSK